TEATQLQLSVEPLAGMTALTLAQAPSGWRVGDRVVLPPTDPVAYPNLSGGPLETEEVRIAAISGNLVTLDHPLANDHTRAYDAKAGLTFLPHLVNLSRNVVLSSENPDGVRGHTMFAERANVDIRYTEFLDLGRTTGAPLDNTTFDSSGNV